MSALEAALGELGELIVVAPHEPLSGCSHRATTHRPLELVARGEDRHMLDGTPVDCTRVGLVHIAADVDWVVSGINQGGNLGADVYMSGTVAAAREAALLGKPAIAVSQYRRQRTPTDWQRATRWTRAVMRRLLEQPCDQRCYWNVNLPDVDTDGAVPEIVFCSLDPHPMPIRFADAGGKLCYAATYQERSRQPGRDVHVCFSGQISVTELSLD